VKRSSARPEDELPTLAHVAIAYLNRVWFESGSSRGLGWAVRVPI
jgi:hypothetical protein